MEFIEFLAFSVTRDNIPALPPTAPLTHPRSWLLTPASVSPSSALSVVLRDASLPLLAGIAGLQKNTTPK